MDIIVKTPRGVEDTVASIIEEYFNERGIKANIKVRPWGYLGIVIIENLGELKYEIAEYIKKSIPEASRVLIVNKLVNANLEDIKGAVAELARNYISSSETFAVRTVRRGTHNFTSIDVNVEAGRVVQEVTNAEVDLEHPDKAIYIEIFQDKAAICLVHGGEEYRKMVPGKPIVLPILRKLSIVQMPYTGPLQAVKKMGVRIGRAAQTFEIGELYIAHYKPITGDELLTFLQGIKEGIESRYEIQKRSYGRSVHKVPVYVYDMYQYVREHRDEPIIVTDPKGAYIMHVKDKLAEIFTKHDKVHVLIGAREGIPVGIFRIATLVIDLIPQVTIATDYALTSTVIAILAALEEMNVLEKYEAKRKRKKRQDTAQS